MAIVALSACSSLLVPRCLCERVVGETHEARRRVRAAGEGEGNLLARPGSFRQLASGGIADGMLKGKSCITRESALKEPEKFTPGAEQYIKLPCPDFHMSLRVQTKRPPPEEGLPRTHR